MNPGNLRSGFIASTGRTATMFVARCLGLLPDVAALHEGHRLDEAKTQSLPLINLENRKAWSDPTLARKIVAERRKIPLLETAAGDCSHIIDVAFYNSPLLAPLSQLHPNARFGVIFRRCEGFVRSATIVSGEDLQPAGWPDPAKPLTAREQFISMGRLKPPRGHPDEESWENWSAIQRNIWLWTTINSHLFRFASSNHACRGFRFETLAAEPEEFWQAVLEHFHCLTPANLSACVAASTVKINHRPEYQIPALGSWTLAEQEMFMQRAHPWEERIYA